jgi:uncharacterized RDD family membrane protein YckC
MAEPAVATDYIVDSVTGVDVSLPIAGLGGRSFAFVIDWHIRIILALAWIYGGHFLLSALYGADVFEEGSKAYVLGVIVPGAAIYFLYHLILEVAMHGRTPGKRLAGVRVVTREGGIPGAGALIVRNIFRIIDSMPMFYIVGLGTTAFTAQHVRIGDLAAGTLLVYDRRTPRDSLSSLPTSLASSLGPQYAEVIEDLLARWRDLDPDIRRDLGWKILKRLDPQGTVQQGDVRDNLREVLKRAQQ